MTLFGLTIKHMRQEKAWQKVHNPKAPRIDDFAPDFELLSIDGIPRFRLSDFWLHFLTSFCERDRESRTVV